MGVGFDFERRHSAVLLLWHGRHNNLTFSSTNSPPSLWGMIWSYSSFPGLPHNTHTPPSRLKTSCFTCHGSNFFLQASEHQVLRYFSIIVPRQPRQNPFGCFFGKRLRPWYSGNPVITETSRTDLMSWFSFLKIFLVLQHPLARAETIFWRHVRSRYAQVGDESGVALKGVHYGHFVQAISGDDGLKGVQ